MSFAIFIPARLASRRLPDKPIRLVGGKPLIQWTYERAMESDATTVMILCDCPSLYDECRKFTDDVSIMETGNNGTQRIADYLEVQVAYKGKIPSDRIINLQCDEPFVEVTDLNRLGTQTDPAILTLVGSRVLGSDGDRHTVKAVVDDETEQCYWFSRYYMGPYCYQHIGVYSFDPSFFRMPGPFVETAIANESCLEQLAWIQNGFRVHAKFTEKTPLSVNTEADLLRMESEICSRSES